MCSIFGSFDVEECKLLRDINTSRGALSHSSTVLDAADLSIRYMTKNRGSLVNFDGDLAGYHLYHQQAPTSVESNSIHPAYYEDSFLWHNGIIKQHTIDALKEKTKHDSPWDTLQLNALITDFGYSALEPIEGSFACVRHYKNRLYMFRNEIAPMFVRGATISSTPFTGSVSMAPNTVYELFPTSKQWIAIDTFENNETPFFFLD